jgi:hypothetical protein
MPTKKLIKPKAAKAVKPTSDEVTLPPDFVKPSEAETAAAEERRLNLKNRLDESVVALKTEVAPAEPAAQGVNNITQWRAEVLQEISEPTPQTAPKSQPKIVTPAPVIKPPLPPVPKSPIIVTPLLTPKAPIPAKIESPAKSQVAPIVKKQLSEPAKPPEPTKPPATKQVITPAAVIKPPKPKITKPRPALGLMLLLPVVFLIIFYLVFYLIRLDRALPQVAAYLPWPAAYINGEFISWRTFNNNLSKLGLFYEQSLRFNGLKQPTRSELEKLALDNLVRQSLVRQILKQNDVTIAFNPHFWVQDFVKRNFESLSALQDLVKSSYNWDIAALNQFVIEPYLERFALEQFLKHDLAGQTQTKNQISALRQRLSKAELSFAEAAKIYSQDITTASSGGSLGWFKLSSLPASIAAEIKKLKPGDISQPILTDSGYHLFLLEKLRGDEVMASHILFKVIDIEPWLSALQQKSTVIKFLTF